jgi:hypothetical protein
MSSPGANTCCMMCGQIMNNGSIRPWSKEDEIEEETEKF